MHYRGFVFVAEPTDEAVEAAMAPHKEAYEAPTEEGEDEDGTYSGHWDWFRAGGRYDGYLVSDEEMRARETDNGFNFDPKNTNVERNSCRAKDVPPDRRRVYFFVVDGEWIEAEIFSGGKTIPVPDFDAQLEAALVADPERWVVVVDAHD